MMRPQQTRPQQTRRRHRWVGPGGANRGMGRATREEAMVEAAALVAGRPARRLGAEEVLAIWARAEADGWRIEELGA
jgi:hypothetical protein